jgi:hypothetical protein
MSSDLFKPIVLPPAESYKRSIQQFGHDTEAGRMLARLYGKGTATVSMPARPSKSKPMVGPQPPMQGLNSRPEAANPRERKFDREAVAAAEASRPVVGHGAPLPKTFAIDSIKGIIRSKAQVDAFEAAHASVDRPQMPIKKGYNTEAEKRRLQATFQFKGGKAVPDAASYAPIEGQIPMHLMGAASAPLPKTGRLAAMAMGASSNNPIRKLIMELESTFDAVQKGLQESVEFIAELRALNACTSRHEKEHSEELQRRTRQLQEIQNKIKELREQESTSED